MIDYHLHTPLCRHATGEPEEYAVRAVEQGISEIGFSDHCPMPAEYDPEFRMKLEEYPDYVGMVNRCASAFPNLKIKLGLEAVPLLRRKNEVRAHNQKRAANITVGNIRALRVADGPQFVAG